MNKGTHFIGQPLFGQLINLLDKEKIAKISRKNGGERYIKKFDVWQHLAIMLYAVIKRYDSLREIAGCMLPEARKLAHRGCVIIVSHPHFVICCKTYNKASTFPSGGFVMSKSFSNFVTIKFLD